MLNNGSRMRFVEMVMPVLLLHHEPARIVGSHNNSDGCNPDIGCFTYSYSYVVICHSQLLHKITHFALPIICQRNRKKELARKQEYRVLTVTCCSLETRVESLTGRLTVRNLTSHPNRVANSSSSL
jgi:hypothetical protein